MSGDRDIDTSQLRAAFVQAQAQIMNNGTYEPVVVISKPLALSLLDEIERLQAEIAQLRAEREDIDLLHVRGTADDMTFCHECIGGWPCRTHLRLHPEEARHA